MKLKVLTYKQLLLSSMLVLIIAFSAFPLISLSENSIFEKKSPKLSAEPITINSPVQGKTYTQHMEGFYPATYGFEREKDGTLGANIGFIDVINNVFPYCFAGIISEKGGHKKVLELYDYSSSDYYLIENNFNGQGYGTIEYWVMISDASRYFLNNIRTGGGTTINFRINNGKWYCYDGYNNIRVPNAPNPVSNQWHHVRIDFECTTHGYMGLDPDRWTITIDGYRSNRVMKFYKERTRNYIDTITFSSHSTQTNYIAYLDAIGYSWDPYYNIGDNIQGYYPATYGFENGIIGETTGADIDFIYQVNHQDPGTNAIISSRLDNHQNILELKDNTDTGYIDIVDVFDQHLNPTIEFWVATSTDSGYRNMYLSLIEYAVGTPIFLMFSHNTLRYNDGSNDIVIVNIEANTFYHVKLVLDDTHQRFDCYIDGIRKLHNIDYREGESTSNGINIFRIFTREANTGYSIYFDAIGYSWDPKYNIGDNLEQGLLLEFEPDDLMGIEYTLDGWQTFYTILGDTVIPMPEDGTHTLEIREHLPGIIYYGSVSFTVDSIDISSPINGKQYYAPMEGYFPATFGFENEGDYEVGTSIDFIDTYSVGENSYAKIYPSWQDHQKVLKLRDNDDEGRVYVYNEFGAQKPESEVEFWWGTSSTKSSKAQLRIKLKEGSNTNVELRFWQTYGTLEYKSKSGIWIPFVNGLSHNRWYHIQIIYYDSIDQYYIFVDGARFGPFQYVTRTICGPTRLYFGTILDKGYSGYSHYIDAVGYSWDDDYSIGDNKYEGLLLEFEPDDLEWMGYMYDGQIRSSIYGDAVIPFYDYGSHSIQILGKSYSGVWYCSKVVNYIIVNTAYLVKKYAIIVGISDYKSLSEEDDLEFCDEDATDWYNHLTGPSMDFDYIWVYGDSHSANYPQYDGIASEFHVKQTLINVVNSADSNDIIAFITSGHGGTDGDGVSFLNMWDYDSLVYGEDGNFYDTELSAILDDALANKIFVFLDNCRSGGFGPDLMEIANSEKIYLTTTCSDIGDGYGLSEYQNGAWTYFFLEYTWINHYGGSASSALEDIFDYASGNYPYGNIDTPEEYDGDTSSSFYLN